MDNSISSEPSETDSTSRGSSGSGGDESSEEEEEDDAGSDSAATNFESVTKHLIADLQGVRYVGYSTNAFKARVYMPLKGGQKEVAAGCMGLPITALLAHELMIYMFLGRIPSQLMDTRELEIEYNSVPEQIPQRRDVSTFVYIYCCITTYYHHRQLTNSSVSYI
jgi:hypothetical protein